MVRPSGSFWNGMPEKANVIDELRYPLDLPLSPKATPADARS